MARSKNFKIPNQANDESTIEWQNSCYGMTQEAMIRYLNTNLRMVFKNTGQEAKDWLSFCMLSDVQELMERNRLEEARQLVNRVKFLLNQTLEETTWRDC